MDSHALNSEGGPLVAVGVLLLVGFAASILGRRAHVPRVTLLLVLGVAAGPSVLDLVPAQMEPWFPRVSEIALSLVGFMLGERFIAKSLRETGRVVLVVAVAATIVPAVVVLLALLLVGAPPVLALLLAGIAPATAPAATLDVVRESRAAGRLTAIVLAVVALDDAFGIVLFTLFLAVAEALGGGGWSMAMLGSSAWEILGGIALGSALGVPMAWMTGRVREGELTLIETLGFVLLCGGLATMIGVSYLLACTALGAVVANRAKHHTRPFQAIEGVSQPLLIVFFILAGFEFDASALGGVGLIGLGYVVARIIGKLAGGISGARLVNAPPKTRKYVGWCLLPQAGVALGLGLLAAQRFPEYGASLLSLLVGTTFVFEVLGPISTRIALRLAGEAGQVPAEADDETAP